MVPNVLSWTFLAAIPKILLEFWTPALLDLDIRSLLMITPRFSSYIFKNGFPHILYSFLFLSLNRITLHSSTLNFICHLSDQVTVCLGHFAYFYSHPGILPLFLLLYPQQIYNRIDLMRANARRLPGESNNIIANLDTMEVRPISRSVIYCTFKKTRAKHWASWYTISYFLWIPVFFPANTFRFLSIHQFFFI